MRTRIKKPLTDYAKHLRLLGLDRLRAEGQNPAAVLEQSIAAGWQDLYPVKASRELTQEDYERHLQERAQWQKTH